MKLVSMNCPGCGSVLTVDADRAKAACMYCGNVFFMDDEVKRAKVDLSEEAGYNFAKGMQRAEQESRELAAKEARDLERFANEQKRLIEDMHRHKQQERTIQSGPPTSVKAKGYVSMGLSIGALALSIFAFIGAVGEDVALLIVFSIIPFILTLVSFSLSRKSIKGGFDGVPLRRALAFRLISIFIIILSIVIAIAIAVA